VRTRISVANAGTNCAENTTIGGLTYL
jgi:hypothetical protein